MSVKLLSALAASLLMIAGCAQNSTPEYAAPERGDPGFMQGKNPRADELYVNADTDQGGRYFRDVYIAPADLSKIQIIQPEGSAPDEAWQVTDVEDEILQRAIVSEFTTTLGHESAYNIVESKDQSEITIYTTIVAIHPNATRSERDAGAKSGGAVTASIALVNTKTGNVMVRSVDTKSTENIWAFNQVDNDDPAVNLIFRSWGNSIRRGMLHLQGRSTDPLAQPVKLKQQ